MTPVFDALSSKFVDVQKSAEMRGYVRGLRHVVDELKTIQRPSKQVIDLLTKFEALLAVAHKPKRGRK